VGDRRESSGDFSGVSEDAQMYRHVMRVIVADVW
jgi:hypothetical protein